MTIPFRCPSCEQVVHEEYEGRPCSECLRKEALERKGVIPEFGEMIRHQRTVSEVLEQEKRTQAEARKTYVVRDTTLVEFIDSDSIHYSSFRGGVVPTTPQEKFCDDAGKITYAGGVVPTTPPKGPSREV
jgi:DNA-directed RNA polymerase subunit N (RpoN/RPB10)